MANLHLHSYTALALAGILVCAPASGLGEWRAELEAASMRVEGTVGVNGTLTAFFLEDLRADDATQPRAENLTDPAFSLQAAQVRLEVDHTDFSVALGVRYNHPATTLPASEYKFATVRGTQNLANHHLYVAPLRQGSATVEAAAGCLEGSPSEVETVSRDPNVLNTRPDLEAPAGSSLLLRACVDDLDLTVVGDFLVVLWEWDGILESDGQQQLLDSGRHGVADDSGLGSSRFVGPADEYFLFVTGGRLTIPNAMGDYSFLAESLAVEVGGTVHVPDATGQIVGKELLAISNQDLVVHGDVAVGLRGSSPGKPLNAIVSGDPTSIALDGRPLAVGTISVAPDRGLPAWARIAGIAGLGAIGLVGVGGASILIRQRRSAALVVQVPGSKSQVVDWLEGDGTPDALNAIRHAAMVAPRDWHTAFLYGRALRRSGQGRKALEQYELVRHLQAIGKVQPAWRAELHFEEAQTAFEEALIAPTGERARLQELALHRLRSVAALDRAVLVDLEAHPGLEDLWTQETGV